MKAFLLGFALLAIAACGNGDDGATTTVSLSPSASRTASPIASRTPAPTTQTPPPQTPTPVRTPALEPAGFPIDPSTTLGVVEGAVGSRTLVFDGTGPTAYDYALNDQPSSDPVVANRSGWNCATHWEYEGIPAVDFYIDIGTPIVATMDGTATLNIVSVNNDFDRYGVSREPYIGNPDRSRAPYSPFPGPSGGLGVYLHLENPEFVTEYGHLDVRATISRVPSSAFIGGYSASTDYDAIFAEVPQPRIATAIAQWDVHKGDIIGMSGDAGYSEGPHLHYTVNRTGGPLRCPTTESDFTDGGWLFK